MTQRTALITGITGQDGSYLAEFLLEKGYKVVGMVRRSSSDQFERLAHLQDRIELREGDLLDQLSIITLLHSIEPQEIYNLAAQSFVPTSWEQPILTSEATALGVTRMLEAIRVVDRSIRFYQASSSEMFGASPPPQNEQTPFYPRSPYGAAKVYSYWATRNYREAYGLFAVNGILFNHESPRRGETFVTRKITRAVARIKAGIESDVYIGNLDAVRDWGYAPEYVEGMWRMLQAPDPEDFVLATGHGYTVRDFVKTAFDHARLDWQKHVKFDERYLRPAEVDALVGDATKAAQSLGWKASIHTADLARIMVDADSAALDCEGKPWIDKPILTGRT